MNPAADDLEQNGDSAQGASEGQEGSTEVRSITMATSKTAAALSRTAGRLGKQSILAATIAKKTNVDLRSALESLGDAVLDAKFDYNGLEEIRQQISEANLRVSALGERSGAAAFLAKTEQLGIKKTIRSLYRKAGEIALVHAGHPDQQFPQVVQDALHTVYSLQGQIEELERARSSIGQEIKSDTSLKTSAVELFRVGSDRVRTSTNGKTARFGKWIAVIVVVLILCGYVITRQPDERPTAFSQLTAGSAALATASSSQASTSKDMLDAIRNLPMLPSENQLIAYLGRPTKFATEVDDIVGLQRWVYYFDEKTKRSFSFLIGLNPSQGYYKAAKQLNIFDGPLADPLDPGRNVTAGLPEANCIEAVPLLPPNNTFQDGSPGPFSTYLAKHREPWQANFGREEFRKRLLELPLYPRPEQTLVFDREDQNTRASWFLDGKPVLRRLYQYKGRDGVYILEFNREPRSEHYHELTRAYVVDNFVPDGTNVPPTPVEVFDISHLTPSLASAYLDSSVILGLD